MKQSSRIRAESLLSFRYGISQYYVGLDLYDRRDRDKLYRGDDADLRDPGHKQRPVGVSGDRGQTERGQKEGDAEVVDDGSQQNPQPGLLFIKEQTENDTHKDIAESDSGDPCTYREQDRG